MWKADPIPKPEDVNCTIWKQCDEKCGKCQACRQFDLKLRDLLPNDVESGYRPRHTFEWLDR